MRKIRQLHLGLLEEEVIINALLIALKYQDQRIRYLRENSTEVSFLFSGRKEGSVTEKIIEAIGELGRSDEEVITTLIEKLKDKDVLVRKAAAMALGDLESSDKRVIRSLAESLNDKEYGLCYIAAYALIKLDRFDEKILVLLIEALKEYITPYYNYTAVGSLTNLNRRYKETNEAMIFALKNKNAKIRYRVAQVLINLGHSEELSITILLEGLKDGSREAREEAAEALGISDYVDEKVINSLFNALKDEEKKVCYFAAIALTKFGHADKEVTATLIEGLEDVYDDVRDQAIEMLGSSELRNEEVIDLLLNELYRSYIWNEKVAAALKNLAKNNSKVVLGLLEMLKDKDKNRRFAAMEALGKIFQQKSNDELLEFLKSNVSGYRYAAACGIARKAHLSEKMLDEINQLKEDGEHPLARLAAWKAFELIQKRNESEKHAARDIKAADSLFSIERFSKARYYYNAAFNSLLSITYIDSVKCAYTHFQLARCEARQNRKNRAITHLEIAFQYNPGLVDALHTELTKKDNDWSILKGNWYLREVLLNKSKENH